MKTTNFKKIGKKLIVMIVVIAMMLNMYVVTFAETTSNPVKTDINSYAPNGLLNIALNKTVTSSSSYETPNEGWCKTNLTDGVLGTAGVTNGWTTNPGDNVTDATSPAAVQVNLGKEYTINRVVLFPRSDGTYGECFPSDFKIQVSSDGQTYSDVHTSIGNGIPTEPFVIDLPQNTEARFVQLYVIKRYSVDSTSGAGGNDGKLVQLSEIAIFGSEVPTYDKTDISSYAPSGLLNIALKKEVTSSSSYETPNEGWCKNNLTDGVLGIAGNTNGWTTHPGDNVTDPNTPASVKIDLGLKYQLSRVILFPRSDGTYGECFPSDFKIQVSSDGQTYSDVHTSIGNGIPTEPFVIDLPQNTEARFVQLYVSKRYSVDSTSGAGGNDGKLVQLSEIAVFGKTTTVSTTLNKNDLLLTPGMTDKLVPIIIKDDSKTVNLTWKSSDDIIATVDQSGLVTAVTSGTAIVTLSDEANGISENCLVTVTDKIKRATDNIMISAFWPPTKDYINDTQYSYLADANITFIQNVTGNDRNEKATNLEMARLAYKYGMQVGVADNRFGENLLKMTDEEVISLANEYKNIPGVGGYYILDEPYNANPFERIFKAFKNADPYGYAHLNFLPNVYGSEKTYENQMNDWVKLANQGGYKLDYLMYDRYPFGVPENNLNYEGFLNNMSSVWKVGLKNNVKTGTYLQSIGMPGGYRRTNGNEIRYEAYMSLAYGFKELSYFCWFTPTGRNETFTDAIITADGQKTDLFEPVKQLNGEILKIGPTLMNLDAKEIYFNGNSYGQKAVPDDFFVHSQTNDDLTFSYLRDKTTGQNYLMVVNNSFTTEKDISLKFVDNITELQEVNKLDGTLKTTGLTGGLLNMHFAKGDGHLFALPVNYDYQKPVELPAAGTNLALGAQAYCATSVGSDGWYMANINDGIRYSAETSSGWKSATNTAESAETSVVLDLGVEQELNRVDLYPAGDLITYATYMPKDFTIDVSSDGSTWITVETVTNLEVRRDIIPSFTFAASVDARYVRISVSKMSGSANSYAVSMAEIEIYNDDGSVPEATHFINDTTVVEYTSGMNIALNKKVYVSSSTPDSFKEWGWSPSFINDGMPTTGWSSNVKINFSDTASEWAAIDFGDLFAINKIKLQPTSKDSAFPYDYTFEMSEDGINWVLAKQITGDILIDSSSRTFDLENPIAARFIRMRGTKLTNKGADGYLMQVGELEAYGNPICNKTSLNTAIAIAEAAKPDSYTEEAFNSIKDLVVKAKELSGSENTTQTVADDIAGKISAALARTSAILPINIKKALKTIKIDGVIDELGWKLDRKLEQKVGSSDNTAKTGLMWDDTYLYVAIDVTDANVVNSGAEYPWNDDSIEIYIDGDLNKGAYTNHSVQYVFRANDDTVYKFGNDSAKTDGILKALITNATGYTLEVAIPWSDIGGFSVEKDKKIGFTAHVNDRDVSDGDTNGVIGLTDMSNGDWHDSSKWIETTLVLPLKDATIVAEKTELTVDGSAILSSQGKLSDDSVADLTGAKIEYFTDKPNLISFENGKAKALAAGTANIWSQVTLNGVTVESNKVAIKITDNIVKSEKSKNIILDGNLNEAGWSKNTTAISKLLDGTSKTISAGFSTVWDKDNLYVGLSVTDSTGMKTDFSKDNMTICVAPKNFRGNPYSADDFQIQIFDEGARIVKGAEGVGKNDTFDTSKVNVSSKFTNEGYVMEISIPWSEIGVIPRAGMKMGFDLMAFDGEDGGAILVWSGDGSNWISTLGYGVLTLTDNSVASIKEINVTTEAGKAPVLPEKVTVVFSNGTEVTANVNWDAISADKYAKAGTNFVVEGTVEGTDIKAKANVTVNIAEVPNNGGQTVSSSSNNTSNNTSVITVNGEVIDVKTQNAKNGIANVEVASAILEKVFMNAVADDKGEKTVKINVIKVEGAKEYVLQLPVSMLQMEDSSRKIEVETTLGNVTIPSNALESMNIQQKNIGLSIGMADRTAISEDLRRQIGDRPILDLNFEVDGKVIAWNNPESPVTVSIDYKPTAEELKDPEHIVVWYIDNAGKVIPVPNGKYDIATGKVVFSTTHFSKYAVAFVNRTFLDINKFGWAKKQIGVLASKGIINGTSETEFSPSNSITRADFLTLLMNTLGLTQKADTCFDDVKTSDYYYAAVATAKKLGITNGVGDNKFNPKGYISRQDMVVLADKALKVAKGYDQDGKGGALDKFKDNSQISQYAISSIANCVNAGIINGSEGKINPKKNTTRAEAAVILYALYNLQ